MDFGRKSNLYQQVTDYVVHVEDCWTGSDPQGRTWSPREDHEEGGSAMSEKPVRLGQREQQIVELLLQGCDNDEIARQLKMARRTVKAHFNRLFMRFGITGGIKRVKLATLLYRRQLWLQASVTESALQTSANGESSNSLLKDSKTKKLPMKSEPLNTLSRTTFESSMTSSDSGTESSLPSGMRPVDLNRLSPEPEVLEAWEHSILGLGEASFAERVTEK